MEINNANLRTLFVAFNAAFKAGLGQAASQYLQIATVVPSTTGSEEYGWLGQLPGLREWDAYRARSVAIERGRDREPENAELWTRDNVQVWISGVRRVVRDRIVDGMVADAEREARRGADGPRAA